ncbi:GNAT family protein [Agromyces sp. G08B096]|uniref:GNAT family protein n=1 Tax=Agromyces sp. G08B096 TaxID=3156399 RepID=A0AAU7W5L4_9MICO
MTEPFQPQFPILTERLALRPHRADDLDDLVEFHGDPEVVRFLPWPLRDREATRAALEVKLGQGELTEPGTWLVLAVEQRDTGTVIGEVLLKWASAEHRQGELGFALGRAHHGKGYAAEAAAAMLRLGFEQLGLHRISAVCLDDNEASAKLLRRLGFSEEGRVVDDLLFKGEWATRRIFGLTEDAWRSDEAGRDAAEIESLARCFLDAFSSAPGVDERMDALRRVMLADARIIRTGAAGTDSFDVESFLEPRRALLTDGTLTDFSEELRSGTVAVSGDVGHWFGRYAKAGVKDGARFTGGGSKSVQCVRTTEGWRISSVAWADDRS